MAHTGTKNRIPAVRVHQWLSEWDKIRWNRKERRSKPPKEFYLFSIRASHLKALSGVYRRSTNRRSSAADLGIQRRHEVERSKEINRFIEYGYPCSNLSEAKRKSKIFDDLRQPGWLPTAIIVNILGPGDERNGETVNESDLVAVEKHGHSTAYISLPKNFKNNHWKYSNIPPIEVIDGQHRLWAFENTAIDDDFEVPVVAFEGLDLSWQAYLFYTINIKPKRINASLAFDLYPLLRTESWLTKFEGHKMYQETRAQELVDLLWSHPESPWYRRINMLGEPGQTGLMVTQAAWIRSLMASFTKRRDGRRVQIGGLYGSKMSDGTMLSWDFAQQAAFLILAGNKLKEAIKVCEAEWAVSLREKYSEDARDPAFYGKDNLLNQDQGIRILLQVINDMVSIGFETEKIDLNVFQGGDTKQAAVEDVISNAIEILKKQNPLRRYLNNLSKCLAAYDWRAASALDPSDSDYTEKLTFRGSGGYRSFRMHILKHLSNHGGIIRKDAEEICSRLGYL